MSENPTDLEPDRRNHAVLCFRAFLWIIPSAVVMATALALGELNSRRFGIDPLLVKTMWFVINGAFIIGTGWFNAALSPRSRETWHGMRNRIILFTLIQPFLIWFIACLVIGWLSKGMI